MSKRNKALGADPYQAREKRKYEAPIPSREHIISVLEQQAKPLRLEKLMKLLNLTDPKSQQALSRRLAAMVRDGQLLQNRRGSYALLKCMEVVKGHVRLYREGYGLVESSEDGGKSYYLSSYQVQELMQGDQVLIRPTTMDDKGRIQAVLIDVLARAMHTLHGVYDEDDGVSYLQPLKSGIRQSVLLRKGHELSPEPGDIIEARIVRYPQSNQPVIVELVTILGREDTPGIEADLAIRMHELPQDFPMRVQKKAEELSATITCADREDWREIPFVTIDGSSARDFDDAVYAARHSQGGFELKVAIADVGHYVKVGDDIDTEARKRATSVYFQDRVLPMLPERLSHDLCSLVPDRDRYAVGVSMYISEGGDLVSSEVKRVLIRSHARLTYQDVQAMIDGQQSVPVFFEWVLSDLVELTHVLLACRKARGAIEFEQAEPQVSLGRDKKIKRISTGKRLFSHRLIEECMLLCNQAVALKMQAMEGLAMYRNHQPPDPEKMKQLQELLEQLQLPVTKEDSLDWQALEKLPSEKRQLLETLFVRSLKQARYESKSMGHFGLSLEHYLHFTSPIRRYPDLMVHRLVLGDLQSEAAIDWEVLNQHCSRMERLAEEASRDALTWLKANYMQNRQGESFPAIVSGVTNFGLFVHLPDLAVDGLVHVTELENDYYRYDALMHSLVGESTGRCYQLGQALTVCCQGVDIWQRKIDFSIVEDVLS